MVADRAAVDAANHERHSISQEKADRAAGVGSSDEASSETSDRDADGRRPWERIRRPNHNEAENNEHKSKDVSGQLGKTLDLSG
ncbi:MAG: hypothetical protein LBU65_13555 [Planctomycetaceae bacterium]|nr:hypothetical protein [Planctomycetaceae bacterium]